MKNDKVVDLKIPKESGSVKSIFKQAQIKARQSGWTKVIIIGENKDGGAYFTSRMNEASTILMLERVKKDLL